jgi:hypothetical protein
MQIRLERSDTCEFRRKQDFEGTPTILPCREAVDRRRHAVIVAAYDLPDAHELDTAYRAGRLTVPPVSSEAHHRVMVDPRRHFLFLAIRKHVTTMPAVGGPAVQARGWHMSPTSVYPAIWTNRRCIKGTLPIGSGIQVALFFRPEVPDLPVILTSGYPVSGWSVRNSADLKTLGSKSVVILRKPFQAQILSNTIWEFIGTDQAEKNENCVNEDGAIDCPQAQTCESGIGRLQPGISLSTALGIAEVLPQQRVKALRVPVLDFPSPLSEHPDSPPIDAHWSRLLRYRCPMSYLRSA